MVTTDRGAAVWSCRPGGPARRVVARADPDRPVRRGSRAGGDEQCRGPQRRRRAATQNGPEARICQDADTLGSEARSGARPATVIRRFARVSAAPVRLSHAALRYGEPVRSRLMETSNDIGRIPGQNLHAASGPGRAFFLPERNRESAE